MRRLLFRNNRGETLVEALAAILIATLSVALLFTCVMASGRISDLSQKQDAEHYNALSGADAQAEVSATPVAPDKYVEITGVDSKNNPQSTSAPVDIYGGTGMYSYKGK